MPRTSTRTALTQRQPTRQRPRRRSRRLIAPVRHHPVTRASIQLRSNMRRRRHRLVLHRERRRIHRRIPIHRQRQRPTNRSTRPQRQRRTSITRRGNTRDQHATHPRRRRTHTSIPTSRNRDIRSPRVDRQHTNQQVTRLNTRRNRHRMRRSSSSARIRRRSHELNRSARLRPRIIGDLNRMRHATGRTIIIDNLKRHRITARRRERIRQDLTRPNRLPGQRPAEPNHNTIRIRRTRPIKRARQQRTILNEPRNRSLICDLRDGYVLDLLAGCAVIIGDHELTA